TLTTLRYWIQYFPSIYLVVGGLVGVLSGWLVAKLRGTSGTAGWPGGALSSVTGLVLAVVVVAGPLVSAGSYVSATPAFAPNGGNALQQLRNHLRGQHLGQV